MVTLCQLIYNTFQFLQLVRSGFIDTVIHDSKLVKLDFMDLDPVVLFFFPLEFKVATLFIVVLKKNQSSIFFCKTRVVEKTKDGMTDYVANML